jgi:hypothetical protein
MGWPDCAPRAFSNTGPELAQHLPSFELSQHVGPVNGALRSARRRAVIRVINRMETINRANLA